MIFLYFLAFILTVISLQYLKDWKYRKSKTLLLKTAREKYSIIKVKSVGSTDTYFKNYEKEFGLPFYFVEGIEPLYWLNQYPTQLSELYQYSFKTYKEAHSFLLSRIIHENKEKYRHTDSITTKVYLRR